MAAHTPPTPPYPYLFSLDVQQRFNDVDMFGHLNNSVYLQFFDLAKYRYFRKVMGDDFDMRSLAMVIVNINCNFYEPAFLNEPLTVLTAVASIGEKSLSLDQRIVNPQTGHVKCTGTTIMAGIDLATLQSAPIPDFARRNIIRFEGREM